MRVHTKIAVALLMVPILAVLIFFLFTARNTSDQPRAPLNVAG